MEALPDVEQLSDADLARLIDTLTEQEARISFERRTLQATLDILCAHRDAPARGGPLTVSVEQLPDILSRRTPAGWLGHERLAFRVAF